VHTVITSIIKLTSLLIAKFECNEGFPVLT
jgi:hypothetical protein